MTGAIIAFVALFALLFWGVPIGFAMGIVGVVGFSTVVGLEPALAMVGQIAVDNVANYNYSVVPLFVLMGALFAHSRMADELYAASYAFLGHRRGGLAMATIIACGGFSAVSGSSLACAATMTQVSVPMMRRYGYAPGFAAGTVAAGSTLDILIPPSIVMVIYAILTNVDLGKLMIAGFLPGALTVVCYILAIVAVTAIWPHLGPAGQRTPWPERFQALREVWPIVALFGTALGGIYFGVFTPTEAAGVGAFGAFVLTLLRRRLKFAFFVQVLIEAARTTSVIFFVVIGALIFANYITVSGASAALQSWVTSLQLAPTALIMALLGIYLLLGCILDASSMSVLTVPIFYPIVVQAGIDPIWFGIFVVIMVGIGMIHPPLGMLLFVVKALVPDMQTSKIFWGVLPFLAADAVRIALLILFPAIVLILPSLMK
jgi:tripartite ATP-independent transporter DctM subunit